MIRNSCAVAIVALVVAAVACSERRGSLSPTAPTPFSTTQSASSLDRAQIAGVIDRTQGVVRDTAVLANWARERGWKMAEGFVVEGVAEITAATGTCPDVTLIVVGVPVTVNAATLFAAPLTCSGLTVGVTAHIVAMLTVDAGVFSVVALGIEVPATTPPSGNTTPPAPGNTTPPSGNSTPPAPGNTTPPAPGNTTPPAPGNTTPPAPGNTTPPAPGNTTPPAPPPGHGPPPPASSVEGSVGALRGACPNLSFKVRGDDVATTADTTFTPVPCSAIRPGSKVAVTGTVIGQTLVAGTVTITR